MVISDNPLTARLQFNDILKKVESGCVKSISYFDESVFKTGDFDLFKWACYRLNIDLFKIEFDLIDVDSIAINDNSEYEYGSYYGKVAIT